MLPGRGVLFETHIPVPALYAPSQGLPFKASVEDVVKFYQGFALSAANVYLKRHPDGRLNGEVRALCGDKN